MITRRRTLAALAAAIAAPFVSRTATAATHPGPKPPPKPPRPPMIVDVILYQNVDNVVVLPFVNPPAYVGGPVTVPDPTTISSCHLTVEDANFGAAVLPTLTMGSGVTFAVDGGGAACDATIKWTTAQMSSILGTLTQPRTQCVGNLNFTAGSTSTTIPMRVQIYPNATSGA